MDDFYDNINLPVPKDFYSDADQIPMDHCLICGKELLESNSDYMIEKVIQINKGRKISIFEHAVCLDCTLSLRQSISNESMDNIQSYFNKHVDFAKRNEYFIENKLFTENHWLSHCVVKGTSISDCNEYQLYCLCKGKNINPALFPYMISEEAILEINELLSVKTKNEMDGFIDKYYGFPPEYRELMYGKKLIFI